MLVLKQLLTLFEACCSIQSSPQMWSSPMLVLPECKQNMTSLRGQAGWAKMIRGKPQMSIVCGEANSTGMPPELEIFVIIIINLIFT
jgi:hypothetical protein